MCHQHYFTSHHTCCYMNFQPYLSPWVSEQTVIHADNNYQALITNLELINLKHKTQMFVWPDQLLSVNTHTRTHTHRSHLLILPGSQGPCHTFHVLFLRDVRLLPQARPTFISSKRKRPAFFLPHQYVPALTCKTHQEIVDVKCTELQMTSSMTQKLLVISCHQLCFTTFNQYGFYHLQHFY